MRDELQYAWWLAGQSGGVLLLPVIGYASLVLGATMHENLLRFWRPHHWLVLTHLLFFAAAVTLGTLGAADSPGAIRRSQANQAASLGIEILFWASFVSCAFWIWRMKGFRWRTACLVGLMQVFVILAFFVASMSITGDWL